MKLSLISYFILILYVLYITIEKTIICNASRAQRHRKVNKFSPRFSRAGAYYSGEDISEINCGLKPATNYMYGGAEVATNEFPFIAALVEGNELVCTATIINKWFVVTSALCFYVKTDYTTLRIRVGSPKYSEAEEEYKVSNVMVNKKFSIKKFTHDIALIRVNREIQFSSSVNAICLPTEQYEESYGVVTVAGWGALTDDSKEGPKVLHKIDSTIVSDQQCSDMYNPVKVYRSYLCTYDSDKRTCSNDHGSPAFQYINGRAVLVGINTLIDLYASCDKTLPSVFTEVSYFLEWISSNIHYKPKPMPRPHVSTRRDRRFRYRL